MAKNIECLIIGLGVFGKSLAQNLKKQNATVVGLDIEEKPLKESQKYLDQIIRADATKEDNLRVLGVDTFDYVFVCIGLDMESSLIAVFHLNNLGAKKIIARSISNEHSLILQKLGASRVIRPEIEAAERLALETTSSFDNFIKFSDNLAVVQLEVPEKMYKKTLQSLNLRSKYKINVISIKSTIPFVDNNGDETVIKDLETIPDPNYSFQKFDRITVMGELNNINKFINDFSDEDDYAS